MLPVCARVAPPEAVPSVGDRLAHVSSFFLYVAARVEEVPFAEVITTLIPPITSENIRYRKSDVVEESRLVPVPVLLVLSVRFCNSDPFTNLLPSDAEAS